MSVKNNNLNGKENLNNKPLAGTCISVMALKVIRNPKYLGIYAFIMSIKNKSITAFDIANHFRIHPNEAERACDYLIRKGFIISLIGEEQ